MGERRRTYTWGDPRQMRSTGQGLSGLEFMRLLATEELGTTPMLATLDYRFGEIREGYIEFICVPAEFTYNPMGVAHGGVAATLLDSAASCAVHTTLPAGMASTTLDLSVHLLRPLVADLGPLQAIGTVLRRGRRTALGRSEIRDAENRMLAHATASCLLFQPEPDLSSTASAERNVP